MHTSNLVPTRLSGRRLLVAILTLVALLTTLVWLDGASAARAAVTTSTTALVPSGSITVDKAGTIIDAKAVTGAINIKADNVTVRNSTVAYGGYHSVRIFDGADGTRIENVTVNCLTSKTNGLVFGRYTAVKVHTKGCRNDFMFSTSAPATIVDSSIDGVAYSPGAVPSGTAPVAPAPTSTTSAPAPTTTTSAPAPTTSTTTSAPVPTTTSVPVLSGFPNASNTGVPAGTVLTASGSITVTTPGTVIDAKHVKGTITISADNVTVRRSLIQVKTDGYPIKVTSGVKNALIEDVEVDNLGGTGIGIFFAGGGGTVRRADIHSAEDGIRVEANNVTVERSYVHHLQRQPGGHHDTFQIRKGDNVTLRYNNFQPYNDVTNDPMNAAIQIGSLLGTNTISNFRVEGNLFNGGNFTINGGGRGEVDSAVYANNQFGRDFRYGTHGNVQNSVWESTNVWYDTKTPV